MKVIIAGGRDFNDFPALVSAVRQRVQDVTTPIEVVCGGAAGADALGKLMAEKEGWEVAMFPADWSKHGRAAGPIRNKEMAEYADCLIAFWDGESRGTKSMIDLATREGLDVIAVHYNKEAL